MTRLYYARPKTAAVVAKVASLRPKNNIVVSGNMAQKIRVGLGVFFYWSARLANFYHFRHKTPAFQGEVPVLSASSDKNNTCLMFLILIL